MENNIIPLMGYVKASNYRLKILKLLLNKAYTPTEIAHETKINKGHVSRTLNQLLEKNLVICGNEKARKGRMYIITDTGKKVLQHL